MYVLATEIKTKDHLFILLLKNHSNCPAGQGCLVGNSSSGIIEAPSLGVYTINIGDRQKGRVRGQSVLDVVCEKEAISSAMSKVASSGRSTYPNPYYQENAVYRYYETTKQLIEQLPLVRDEPKIFYDLL